MKNKFNKGFFGLFILIMASSLSQRVFSAEHEGMKHQKNKHRQGMMMNHGGGHAMHGMHGMVIKGVDKFPSTSYKETKKPRPIERPTVPSMKGDPVKGKMLAFAKSKGRCLSCHIMGADGDQAGNIGPNLSTYANLNRGDEYTFQQIWDARAHNPKTMMPPFGTNSLLNRHEALNIMAYVNTLKTPVNEPQRAKIESPNYLIADEDFTLADVYIEQGEAIFQKKGSNGKSCASCHAVKNAKAPELKGAALSYPKYDASIKKVIDLEQRINVCQKKYKHSKPYRLGSKPSNVLASYVKYLSRRMPINVSPQGVAVQALARGKASFFKKAGQLNFSCADCHASAANKWLRGQFLNDITEKGSDHETAATWPKHFIAGHDLGLISLRQRIRHCQIVTRTNPLPLHSQEYTDLELYITTLANGEPEVAPTKSKLRGSDY